jgi:hypothetical protein
MEDFLDHNAAFKERISGLFTIRLFFRMENVSGNGSSAITLELVKKEAKYKGEQPILAPASKITGELEIFIRSLIFFAGLSYSYSRNICLATSKSDEFLRILSSNDSLFIKKVFDKKLACKLYCFFINMLLK